MMSYWLIIAGMVVVTYSVRLSVIVMLGEATLPPSLKLIVGVSAIKDGRRTYRIKTGPITPVLSAQFRRIVGLG